MCSETQEKNIPCNKACSELFIVTDNLPATCWQGLRYTECIPYIYIYIYIYIECIPYIYIYIYI